MLVDQTILRLFASQCSDTAATVNTNELGEPVKTGCISMPGSTSAWAAQFVGEYAATIGSQLAEGFSTMAVTAKGTADNYEVTDEALAATIGKVLPES